MQLKLALLAAAVAVTALPASAQAGYYRGPGPGGFDPCPAERRSNQLGGAIVGSIIGGVLGSNVSARGHRSDGTALGAVLGGVVGSEAGRGGTDCRGSYGTAGYPVAQYPEPPPPPLNTYPYGDEPPPYDGRDYRQDGPRPLARRGHGSYNHGSDNDDYADRECATVDQTTRLPDGTVMTRPVEACRVARYGDWHVRD